METEVIVAIIALIGVVVNALVTKNSFTNELDKQQALINQKIEDMDEHIREHNHYAKLFAESMPVVQEQIKVINHRLDDLERK